MDFASDWSFAVRQVSSSPNRCPRKRSSACRNGRRGKATYFCGSRRRTSQPSPPPPPRPPRRVKTSSLFISTMATPALNLWSSRKSRTTPCLAASTARPGAKSAAPSSQVAKFASAIPSRLWPNSGPYTPQCVARKQFRQERPLSFYAEMVRSARCHDAVRLYSAWRNGRPCAMALVVRDRDTAHCPIAAQDGESAGCSTSTLLHWVAMRDMHKLGTRFYNLGQAPGTLARFKQQFSPRAVCSPGVVSLIVDGPRFQLWQKVLLPLAKSARPTVRKVSGRFYQKNSKQVIPAVTQPSATNHPSTARVSAA